MRQVAKGSKQCSSNQLGEGQELEYIEAYLRPTGLSAFPKVVLGASQDGQLFERQLDRDPGPRLS